MSIACAGKPRMGRSRLTMSAHMSGDQLQAVVTIPPHTLGA
jgi:hypothetical protein